MWQFIYANEPKVVVFDDDTFVAFWTTESRIGVPKIRFYWDKHDCNNDPEVAGSLRVLLPSYTAPTTFKVESYSVDTTA